MPGEVNLLGGDKLKCKLKPSSVSLSLPHHDLVDASILVNSEHAAPKASLGEIINIIHHIRIEQLKAREHQKYILVGLSIMVTVGVI